MEKLKISINFHSDLSVGSGYGIPGILDNTVIKTHEGIPFIPGTTIKGVIRDACEEIARMYPKIVFPEKDKPRTLQNSPLSQIFGSSLRPAGYIFSSADCKISFNQFMLMRDHVIGNETHNKIDEVCGTAIEDHLFSYETTGKNFSFDFSIEENPLNIDTIDEISQALLIAGILFVNHIGAKKTRGRGLCDLLINEESWYETRIDDWIEILDKVAK